MFNISGLSDAIGVEEYSQTLKSLQSIMQSSPRNTIKSFIPPQ